MKILYLDLPMGAAGDMLTAALYELLDEGQKKVFLDTVNALGIEGVRVCAKTSEKCGITGIHMEVLVDGAEEHEHHHDHDHHHDHSSMEDISRIVSDMPLSEKVRTDIESVYGLIAEAESTVHNKKVSLIHFHEVGSKDAIVDVASVCLLMEMLSVDKVYASPVCTGYGRVKCAHGILPVPAPATALLLNGIPVYAGDTEAELCTPTGAALLRYFVDGFMKLPELCMIKIGYGMGNKDFETANCVRAILAKESGENNDIIELSCNVDDMTPEAVGYASEVFFDNGAVDVYTVGIGMKKSRPGVMINVMCRPEDKEKFVELIFKHTSTIGIRENHFIRYTLDRKNISVSSSYGDVRIKRSSGYGITRSKYEYDDVCKIADAADLSFDETVKMLDGEIHDK